jgi:hypothetical protein
MPSLLQNMVGFSEVARATQTDPRPQRPAPPQPQAATMPWSQPGSWARRGFVPAWSQPPALSQQKLARRCCLGPWAGLIPHQQPLPRHPPQASSFPTTAGLWPPAFAQCGTLGHRAIYLVLWPPFLGPWLSSLQEKPHFIPQLPPACTPHPVPWWGLSIPGSKGRRSAPFLPLSLGRLGAQLWKHHPATHLSCGSRFFGGS